MTALLKRTTQFPADGRTVEGLELRTFFEDGECIRLIRAIVEHPMFSYDGMLQQSSVDPNGGILEFAVSMTRRAVVAEVQVLAKDKALRLPMSSFDQSKIDSFTFDSLDQSHGAGAPVLRSLLMAVAKPDNEQDPPVDASLDDGSEDSEGESSSSDSDVAADAAPAPRFAAAPVRRKDRNRQHKQRNRTLIAICALGILTYARSKNANLFQVVMGYFAFASGVKKRFMEPLHQLGLMVSYESVIRALKANANATAEKLQLKA